MTKCFLNKNLISVGSKNSTAMNEKYGLYALFSMRYTNSPIHDFTTWKRRIVIKIVNFFHEFYQSLYREFSKENNAFVFSPTICNSSIKKSCSTRKNHYMSFSYVLVNT